MGLVLLSLLSQEVLHCSVAFVGYLLQKVQVDEGYGPLLVDVGQDHPKPRKVRLEVVRLEDLHLNSMRHEQDRNHLQNVLLKKDLILLVLLLVRNKSGRKHLGSVGWTILPTTT